MFEISEDTKNAAVAAMREELLGARNPEFTFDEAELDQTEVLGRMFDKAVQIVKQQFGF